MHVLVLQAQRLYVSSHSAKSASKRSGKVSLHVWLLCQKLCPDRGAERGMPCWAGPQGGHGDSHMSDAVGGAVDGEQQGFRARMGHRPPVGCAQRGG